MKKILLTIAGAACLTAFSCTGYVDTFRSYSDGTAQITRAESESTKAYYELQARIFEQQTKLKIAAIEHAGKNSGGTVIFMGDSGFDVRPIQNNIQLSAPDSAPGFKYAIEGMKTLATGAAAVLIGGEIFRTIRDISGTVSNVSNTVTTNRTNTNNEANQANITNTDNSVSDSFKKSETSTITEDNSTLHENSYNQNDENHDNDNSDNSDSSDNSNNSDNSDNSDNSVTRPAVISPTVIQPTVINPVVYPPENTDTTQ